MTPTSHRSDLARRPGVLAAAPKLKARARTRRRAQWQRARQVGLVLAALLPLAVLGALALSSSALDVDRVQVTGTARLTSAQVIAAAQVDKGTPLVAVDTGAVRARVSALGEVSAVRVYRSWPGTLQIRVVERTAVAAHTLPNGAHQLVDATGVPFATARGVPAGTPTLTVPAPGPRADDPTTRAALEVLTELSAGLRTKVISVRGVTPESVVLLVQPGRRVVWGPPGGDGARKSATVELLLTRPGGSIDVTSGEIAVVKVS